MSAPGNETDPEAERVAETAPTVYSGPAADHPLDRSSLLALEARVGEECALASCVFEGGGFAVTDDRGLTGDTGAVVIQEWVASEWVEISRHEMWTDAYRMLGELIDDVIARVPVDPIDRPSPTLVMAGADGFVEVLYRTAEGVRVARELGSGPDLRLEVFTPLWEDFITATDDEATDAELQG